jgi:hypothetical protein
MRRPRSAFRLPPNSFLASANDASQTANSVNPDKSRPTAWITPFNISWTPLPLTHHPLIPRQSIMVHGNGKSTET